MASCTRSPDVRAAERPARARPLGAALLCLALALAASGCAAPLTTIQRACGSGPNAGRCTGPMEVPAARADSFRAAGRLAVDVVFSTEFETAVARFVEVHAADPRIASDWEGWPAGRIVSALRTSLSGAALGTRDGPWQWLRHMAAGNLADEAKPHAHPSRPATVNRWGLRGRDAASLANSIVHEAAHQAGMRHDGKPRTCGPPYVIGQIVESLARTGRADATPLCPLPAAGPP